MEQRPITINGHSLTRTGENIYMGSIGLLWEWLCHGCGAKTDAGGFSVGRPCGGK